MNNKYIGFIYITTNKINGTRYIGQHKQFKDDYLGSGILLHRAIEKYGKENFERTIIDYAKTPEELNELERMYIEKYKAVEDPSFYNIAIGGGAINYWEGKVRDEETRSKIKENNGMKGNGHIMIGKFAGEKNPNYGRIGSPHKKVLMMDLEFNIIKEFSSMADLWRYCEEEFNEDRGPGTKDRLYIRGRQIYKDEYYFCKESELEDFLQSKKVLVP